MQQEPDPPPALPSAGSREFVHKLNNLLTVVMSHAESSLEREDPAEMRKALRIIMQASTSMADALRVFARSNHNAGRSSQVSRRTEDMGVPPLP